jgi:hypothetical protein
MRNSGLGMGGGKTMVILFVSVDAALLIVWGAVGVCGSKMAGLRGYAVASGKTGKGESKQETGPMVSSERDDSEGSSEVLWGFLARAAVEGLWEFSEE